MTYVTPDFSAASAGGPATTRPQIAALCWRLKRGKVEILLITSRDTGRWVIPKGWPMDGRAAHEAAEIEAWEEAGVRGLIAVAALGSFTYDKLHPAKPPQRCEVTVYPLRVARLEAKFPERSQRQRKWFSAARAAKSVAEHDLADLIRSAAATLAKV